MKTLEEIQDEIRGFTLDRNNVTADDLLRVVNLLSNVVDHLQEMNPSDDHPEADCQNEI